MGPHYTAGRGPRPQLPDPRTGHGPRPRARRTVGRCEVTRACTRAHARVPECCSRGFFCIPYCIWHIYYYFSANISLYKRTVLSVSLYVRYVRPRLAGSCTCRAGVCVSCVRCVDSRGEAGVRTAPRARAADGWVSCSDPSARCVPSLAWKTSSSASSSDNWHKRTAAGRSTEQQRTARSIGIHTVTHSTRQGASRPHAPRSPLKSFRPTCSVWGARCAVRDRR